MRRPSKTPSCDRKEDLVTYLYGEASSSESKLFEQHLNECAVCREELDALSSVRQTMQVWELDRVPHIQVNIRPTFWQAFKQFFQAAPMWGRVAMAGACALMVMAILNVNVSAGPNGLTFTVGLRPAPQVVTERIVKNQPPSPSPAPTPVDVKYNPDATRALVVELIKASEARQDARLAAQLQNISTQLSVRNDAALVKAVASLKDEQRQHLINVLQESDRHKAPDLLDLLGQTQTSEPGSEQ